MIWYVIVLCFSEFLTVYELGVNKCTQLVFIGEGAESIMFLEPDVDAASLLTSSLKLKSIVDGVPEARCVLFCLGKILCLLYVLYIYLYKPIACDIQPCVICKY